MIKKLKSMSVTEFLKLITANKSDVSECFGGETDLWVHINAYDDEVEVYTGYDFYDFVNDELEVDNGI